VLSLLLAQRQIKKDPFFCRTTELRTAITSKTQQEQEQQVLPALRQVKPDPFFRCAKDNNNYVKSNQIPSSVARRTTTTTTTQQEQTQRIFLATCPVSASGCRTTQTEPHNPNRNNTTRIITTTTQGLQPPFAPLTLGPNSIRRGVADGFKKEPLPRIYSKNAQTQQSSPY
jgi:hypothetical protein